MSTEQPGVPEYRALYCLDEQALLPGGGDGRDEAAVVAQAAVEYDQDQHRAFEIRPPECALLVVDMQREFVTPGGPMWVPHAQRILPRIASLASTCRALNIPVVLTAATYLRAHPNDTKAFCAPVLGGALAEGSPGVEVSRDLLEPGDYVVRTKYTYNAFSGTELDARLRGHGVRTVIVTGTLTNYCCESTARGAFDLGYHVVFGDDLTATDSAEAHRATLRTLRRGYARVLTAAELTAALVDGDSQYRSARSGQRDAPITEVV